MLNGGFPVNIVYTVNPSAYISPDPFYLVSKYAHFGNAEAFLEKGNNRQEFALRLVDGVVSGLNYLHCDGKPYDRNGIPKPGDKYLLYHGDLKPTNVLVGGDENNPIAWIGDFDFTGVLAEGGTIPTAETGSSYAAPEFWESSSRIDRERRRYYFKKGDIYALGFTVYTMLTGNPPFNIEDYHDLNDFKNESKKNPCIFAQRCPQKHEMGELYDVFSLCWEFEADKRPAMETIAENYGKMQ